MAANIPNADSDLVAPIQASIQATVQATVIERLDRDLVVYEPGALIALSPEAAAGLQALGLVVFAQSAPPGVPPPEP